MTLLFRNVMKRYGNMRTCELLNIYRPQRSCGQVIFSQASVSHSVHGGGVCTQCMLGYTLPPRQVPPGRYTPPGQVYPPGQVHPFGQVHPPWQVHPLLECFLVLNYFWPHRDFRIIQQQMDLYFNCSCHLERFPAE